VAGFIDLHCHWLPQVDDGARSLEEGLELLERLGRGGFSHVVATPHLRPGLFQGTPESLLTKFEETAQVVAGLRQAEDPSESPTQAVAPRKLPQVSLGSEHFFDPTVVNWILSGRGLPYGTASSDPAEDNVSPFAKRAILIEFHDLAPAPALDELLHRLRRAHFVPVIAHPERYASVWAKPELVERIVDQGGTLLLDVAALVGKYGKASQKAAFELLDLEAYGAACTDSHRPSDADLALAGMASLEQRYGKAELEFLFREGPEKLLRGETPI